MEKLPSMPVEESPGEAPDDELVFEKPIERRDFLKKIGAAALGVALVGLETAQPVKAEAKQETETAEQQEQIKSMRVFVSEQIEQISQTYNIDIRDIEKAFKKFGFIDRVEETIIPIDFAASDIKEGEDPYEEIEIKYHLPEKQNPDDARAKVLNVIRSLKPDPEGYPYADAYNMVYIQEKAGISPFEGARGMAAYHALKVGIKALGYPDPEELPDFADQELFEKWKKHFGDAQFLLSQDPADLTDSYYHEVGTSFVADVFDSRLYMNGVKENRLIRISRDVAGHFFLEKFNDLDWGSITATELVKRVLAARGRTQLGDWVVGRALEKLQFKNAMDTYEDDPKAYVEKLLEGTNDQVVNLPMLFKQFASDYLADTYGAAIGITSDAYKEQIHSSADEAQRASRDFGFNDMSLIDEATRKELRVDDETASTLPKADPDDYFFLKKILWRNQHII